MNSDRPLVPQGPPLVAPVSARLVAASVVIAFLLTLLPWPEAIAWLVPDFALVVLLYWHIHAPQHAPLGLAFVLGLLADAAQGVLMGQQALTYVLAAAVALNGRRRVEGFQLTGRAIHLAPLFLAQKLLYLLLGVVFGEGSVDWRYLAGGLTAVALWLPLAYLLDRLTGWTGQMHIVAAEDKK